MKKEIWKSVVGFEFYEVSNLGRIRSLDKVIPHWRGGDRLIRGEILKPVMRKGYQTVNLAVMGRVSIKSIHRLVCESFLTNPNSFPVVNHKDSNPLNNRVVNLEWCSVSRNTQHAYDNGKAPKRFGEENVASKLTARKVLRIRNLQGSMRGYEIAEKFGVSTSNVHFILNRKTWNHI